MSTRAKKYLAKRERYGANHYKPNTKVVFEHAKGIYEGKIYIDAASGYSSVNLGHNHPAIRRAGKSLYAADKNGWGIVSVVPNAFLTVAQADFLEHACKFLGADRAIATNGGAEGMETAIKLMLKWGYTRKNIPEEGARIVMFEGNFHGRTTTLVAGSSEKKYREHFGPYAKNIVTLPYNDIHALEILLSSMGDRVAGIVIEPIQGEGGVRIPKAGYLAECYALCKKHNVIFCADEIQTGLGRTGMLLASWHEGVKPDIFVLAKSLGAGKNATAIVFAKEEFMCFEWGEHGSTYGGNAAAMTLALEVLRVIEKEKLCERSLEMGDILFCAIANELRIHSLVREVRGRGLMIGIELAEGVSAERVIDLLLEHGVMTKDAHGVIRITPPLIITKKQCAELAKRIGAAFRALAIEHARNLARKGSCLCGKIACK